jgi:glyoxalase family protein
MSSSILGIHHVTAIAGNPQTNVDFWRQRLEESLVRSEDLTRFGAPGLSFADPDGLPLELIESSEPNGAREPWKGSSVPVEHAIRGFDNVTLLHADGAATERLLVDAMGYRKVATDGQRVRYESGDGGSGAFVDVLRDPNVAPGRVAGGSVHHVAFRVTGRRRSSDHIHADAIVT